MNALCTVSSVFIAVVLLAVTYFVLNASGPHFIDFRMYNMSLNGAKILHRGDDGRYRLGRATRIARVDWFLARTCKVQMDGEPTPRDVRRDDVVLVEDLMIPLHVDTFRKPLSRDYCRAFTPMRAFVLNALSSAVGTGASVELRINDVKGDSAVERVVQTTFLNFCVLFGIYTLMYWVLGFGANQIASRAPLVLSREAALTLFNVTVTDKEEFVVVEDNATLFADVPSRRAERVRVMM
tara:strand:- start:193 stop:906 length:714 start_codon:yes stop_codon:yes gene_type:complete